MCSVDDDKVVDSRAADEGAAIRRRRACLACAHRFTTYERLEAAPLVVVKRAGHRVPYDRARLVAGARVAATDRPVTEEALEALASDVEDALRVAGPEVTTEQIGLAVLERLRRLDLVAALRFASVYKQFSDPADFEAEIALLTDLTKATEPKTS